MGDREQPQASRLIERRWAQHTQDLHQHRLANTIRSSINISPPPTFSHLAQRSKRKQKQQENQVKIEYENKILMKKMNQIQQEAQMPEFSQTQTSDTAAVSFLTQKGSLTNAKRHREQIQIHAENTQLLQRLSSLHPTYNVLEWEKEHWEKEKHLQQMGRFRYVSPLIQQAQAAVANGEGGKTITLRRTQSTPAIGDVTPYGVLKKTVNHAMIQKQKQAILAAAQEQEEEERKAVEEEGGADITSTPIPSSSSAPVKRVHRLPKDASLSSLKDLLPALAEEFAAVNNAKNANANAESKQQSDSARSASANSTSRRRSKKLLKPIAKLGSMDIEIELDGIDSYLETIPSSDSVTTSTSTPLPQMHIFLRDDTSGDYLPHAEVTLQTDPIDSTLYLGKCCIPILQGEEDRRVRVAIFQPSFVNTVASTSPLNTTPSTSSLIGEARFSLIHFLSSSTRVPSYKLKLLKHGAPIGGAKFTPSEIGDEAGGKMSEEEVKRRKERREPILSLVHVKKEEDAAMTEQLPESLHKKAEVEEKSDRTTPSATMNASHSTPILPTSNGKKSKAKASAAIQPSVAISESSTSSVASRPTSTDSTSSSSSSSAPKLTKKVSTTITKSSKRSSATDQQMIRPEREEKSEMVVGEEWKKLGEMESQPTPQVATTVVESRPPSSSLSRPTSSSDAKKVQLAMNTSSRPSSSSSHLTPEAKRQSVQRKFEELRLAKLKAFLNFGEKWKELFVESLSTSSAELASQLLAIMSNKDDTFLYSFLALSLEKGVKFESHEQLMKKVAVGQERDVKDAAVIVEEIIEERRMAEYETVSTAPITDESTSTQPPLDEVIAAPSVEVFEAPDAITSSSTQQPSFLDNDTSLPPTQSILESEVAITTHQESTSAQSTPEPSDNAASSIDAVETTSESAPLNEPQSSEADLPTEASQPEAELQPESTVEVVPTEDQPQNEEKVEQPEAKTAPADASAESDYEDDAESEEPETTASATIEPTPIASDDTAETKEAEAEVVAAEAEASSQPEPSAEVESLPVLADTLEVPAVEVISADVSAAEEPIESVVPSDESPIAATSTELLESPAVDGTVPTATAVVEATVDALQQQPEVFEHAPATSSQAEPSTNSKSSSTNYEDDEDEFVKSMEEPAEVAPDVTVPVRESTPMTVTNEIVAEQESELPVPVVEESKQEAVAEIHSADTTNNLTPLPTLEETATTEPQVPVAPETKPVSDEEFPDDFINEETTAVVPPPPIAEVIPLATAVMAAVVPTITLPPPSTLRTSSSATHILHRPSQSHKPSVPHQTAATTRRIRPRDREEAATMIQALHRGRATRRKKQKIFEEKLAVKQAIQEATKVIKHDPTQRKASVPTQPAASIRRIRPRDKEEAATMIQALHRGRAIRRKKQKIFEEKLAVKQAAQEAAKKEKYEREMEERDDAAAALKLKNVREEKERLAKEEELARLKAKEEDDALQAKLKQEELERQLQEEQQQLTQQAAAAEVEAEAAKKKQREETATEDEYSFDAEENEYSFEAEEELQKQVGAAEKVVEPLVPSKSPEELALSSLEDANRFKHYTLTMTVSCTGLPTLSGLIGPILPSPMIAVYAKPITSAATLDAAFTFVCQTERVEGSITPTFHEPLLIDITGSVERDLMFSVYSILDEDSSIRAEDVMGTALITQTELYRTICRRQLGQSFIEMRLPLAQNGVILQDAFVVVKSVECQERVVVDAATIEVTEVAEASDVVPDESPATIVAPSSSSSIGICVSVLSLTLPVGITQCNSLAALYTKDHSSSNYLYLTQTDVCTDTLTPVFATPMYVQRPELGHDTDVMLNLYNHATTTSEDEVPEEAVALGACLFEVNALLAAADGTLTVPLVRDGEVCGQVQLHYEKPIA